MNFGFVCFRLHHVGGSEFGCFKEEKRLEYYYNYLIYNILFFIVIQFFANSIYLLIWLRPDRNR